MTELRRSTAPRCERIATSHRRWKISRCVENKSTSCRSTAADRGNARSRALGTSFPSSSSIAAKRKRADARASRLLNCKITGRVIEMIGKKWILRSYSPTRSPFTFSLRMWGIDREKGWASGRIGERNLKAIAWFARARRRLRRSLSSDSIDISFCSLFACHIYPGGGKLRANILYFIRDIRVEFRRGNLYRARGRKGEKILLSIDVEWSL